MVRAPILSKTVWFRTEVHLTFSAVTGIARDRVRSFTTVSNWKVWNFVQLKWNPNGTDFVTLYYVQTVMVRKVSNINFSGNSKLKLQLKTFIPPNITNLCLSRIPQDPQLKVKWIESIQKYQEFDHFSVHFSVCNLHFEPESITAKGHLRKNSIPTIFSR